jgi:hypothetical protein
MPVYPGAQIIDNAMLTFASTDCQFDRLADTTEHFHERVDGEPGRFFVHDIGHAGARDH